MVRERRAPARRSRSQRHGDIRISYERAGEIVAGDRPGLLAQIAWTLAQANVNVASARINTLGERAEDVFLIDGARLHDEQALLKLETSLYDQLHV